MGKKNHVKDFTGNISDSFFDVFQIEEIQKLQDMFSKATGVASVITLPNGTPITEPSGFTCLCKDIIRNTEIGLANCIMSDSIIGSKNQNGPHVQKCLSAGLMDGGVRIIVDGHHIGNWLIGQVLEPDTNLEDLLVYADTIGADRHEYSEQLKKIKHMTKDQFQEISNFLYLNAQLLSRNAIKNKRLNHEIELRMADEAILKRINQELEAKVQIRTKELRRLNIELEGMNASLEAEIEERSRVENELTALNAALEEKILERTIQLRESNKALEEEVIYKTYLSYHDQLTGLYNRRFFEAELARLDKKRNLPITIILADINGLKIINDSFGHAIGDKYLKKSAEILKDACRADEIIARLGGDEFGIILPKTSSAEAAKIINRIKELQAKANVGSIELSVSFGYETKEKEAQSIAEITTGAENQMYAHKLAERSSMRGNTIGIIMKALFEKSAREAQHSQRVSELCEDIAIKLGFDEDKVEQIRIAGLIHDIGKIGISEAILNKEGRPENDEWSAIKRHPEAGWRILSTTVEFSEVARFILHHHEKLDGTGYPSGLKGEEIPIQSRIIAVADAYDAMTSERSYRKAISREEAIEEIKRCSGTHFDPHIVEVFVR